MNTQLNNVVSLAGFRAKKAQEKALAGERTPLYKSYPFSPNFGGKTSHLRQETARLEQILLSLKKISKTRQE